MESEKGNREQKLKTHLPQTPNKKSRKKHMTVKRKLKVKKHRERKQKHISCKQQIKKARGEKKNT